MALTGKTNAEKIWNYLYPKIGNKYGTAGLMGNLYAESALNPKNLQDSFQTRLGFNDNSYTEAVDRGTYNGFIHDTAGYGLAQWTYWTRKRDLYNYTVNMKVSIGDLEGQLGFLWKELQGYSIVLSTLKKAKTVKEASDIVLTKFEAPADQSTTVKDKRASYGQNYFDQFAGEKAAAVIETPKEENADILKFIDSAFHKYLTSSTHYISNSGGDENGKISGGQAGDQTGKEWRLRTWYNRPWSCVLRYPDEKVAMKIAELGIKAALNDKVGYDQGQRDTYWNQLQAVGYDPSKITKTCEADCSAGVIANVKAVGFLFNINALKYVKATYTGNMRDSFKNAGFIVLTESKYLVDDKYLKPGDILLNDNHHTATNITYGVLYNNTSNTISEQITAPTNTVTVHSENYLNVNMSGNAVKTMQTMLIACGYSCGKWGADGDFGNATLSALRKFQTDNGLLIDGIYGPASKAKLEALYQEKTAAQKAADKAFNPYLVKITADALNVRKEPSSKSKKTDIIKDRGVYTIVAEKDGWGKLKSGAGWISLKYTKKV